MMELIRLFLDQGWQVTFASPAAETEHMADLTSLGVQTALIKVNDSSFDAFAAETSPDIVLFDRFMMEEQFGWRIEKVCPNALRMIELIDLHLLRDARHRLSKASQCVATDVDDAELFSDIARREIASVYRSDLTLLISDYEERLLEERFSIPASLLHLTPFMFDESDIVHPTPSFKERQGFITIGNFRHAPNWDSVRWLKEAIWPLIRKQLPEAELHIYGSYPPKKATQLDRPEDGFHLRGWAPDALEVMQQARVCLAPLRFGAGIKGKLADAMLAGTPNVTTSVGAEAMSGELPWSGLIEEDAKSFAKAAAALYKDEKEWLKCQANGFNIISQLFNKQKNSEFLISRILQLKDRLEEHRQTNFVGGMLRHHHQRSTEFMSRWIEEKNKNLSE